MSLKSHVLAIIEGKKKAPLTRMLLKALSHCYQAGVHVHHFAYDWVIPQIKLDRPVISVGNIVAGGTGKTPFVHYLASQIGQDKVAILSRGYGRKNRKTLLVRPQTSVEEAGDEPLLLARKLPKAKVIVGKDRAYSGLLAQTMGVEYILLDDGMQHLNLHRDIEISLVDGQNPLGFGYFLPRGLLRDTPSRLKKADLIIVNHVKEENFNTLSKKIHSYTDAPITAMNLTVENSGEVAHKKVGVFSAIASPSRFTDTLESLGCAIVLKQEKVDHIPFTAKELEHLSTQAKALGAACLVCTEKDFVKLPEEILTNLPIIPLKISLTPTFGKEHLEKLIARLAP